MNVSNFSPNQLSGLVGLGIVLWGIGVIKIRYIGQRCYTTNFGRISTFFLSIPLGFGLTYIPQPLFGIKSTDRLSAVTLVAGTTLLLDGIGFTWFPHLYEDVTLKKVNPRSAAVISRLGSGWLLYGTGLCLIMTWLTT